MNTIGLANKRAGVKKGKAPATKKKAVNFGSKTEYAEPSKLKIGLTGKKK